MNRDFEINVIKTLKAWGETMGNNLLVADWDIGDHSYIELGRDLGIKTLPSIVLGDSQFRSEKGYCIVIDDQSVVKDVDAIKEVLPDLVNRILIGQSEGVKNALKDAIKKRQHAKIKSLVSSGLGKLGKIKKLKFGYEGAEVEIDTN